MGFAAILLVLLQVVACEEDAVGPGGGVPFFCTEYDVDPVEFDSIETLDRAEGVAVINDYVFVADGEAGLLVFDVLNPRFIRPIAGLDTPGVAWSVTLDDVFAYVADGPGGVHVVRIDNPRRPDVVSTLFMNGSALAVDIAPDLIGTVAAGDRGIVMVNFTLDDPVIIGAFGSFDGTSFALDVVSSGRYLFVAHGEAGLVVMDAGDPTLPVPVTSRDTPGLARGLFLDGVVLYLADDGGGLRIYDVSDPEAPLFLGSRDLGARAFDVTVTNLYAYVAASTGGLIVLDVVQPGSILEVGAFPATAEMVAVATDGVSIYVAAAQQGVVALPPQCEVPLPQKNSPAWGNNPVSLRPSG